MAGKCVRCGNLIPEIRVHCDSFRCILEDTEYTEFTRKHGEHCYECFEDLRYTIEAEPRPYQEVPACRNCNSADYVIPVRSRMGEILGWMCQACEWREEPKCGEDSGADEGDRPRSDGRDTP